jgi:hypothetical protein
MFSFILPKKEIGLLKLLQSYFQGVGNISPIGKDRITYIVRTLNDLNIIISHFDRYPLLTQLGVNYELFKSAVEMIKDKKHLTEDIEEIINLSRRILRNKNPEEYPSESEIVIPDSNELVHTNQPTLVEAKKILDPH